MKKTLLLVFAIAFAHYANACYNEMKVLLNGKTAIADYPFRVPKGHDFAIHKYEYEAKLKELASKWETEKNIDDYSDYGVTLAYLGNYKEALRVFKEIENLSPGHYATAANMGTTYELLGKNDSAYLWIKKAVKINPASHDSSEWLHLKILEVKIKGDSYLNSRFLTGTDFGNDSIPKSSLSVKQLGALRDALYYQLNERVSFIAPPDKIVALLLFELGNADALVEDATTAYKVYEMARDYGYNSSVFNKRYVYMKNLQKLLQTEGNEDIEETDNSYANFVLPHDILVSADSLEKEAVEITTGSTLRSIKYLAIKIAGVLLLLYAAYLFYKGKIKRI